MRRKWPERGDLVHLDFDPSKGREQQGKRYALVLTREPFNRFGLVLAAPITQGGGFARENGFTVSLTGSGMSTQGVVLCNQVRMLDFTERAGRVVEKAPDDLVDEVLARVRTLLD